MKVRRSISQTLVGSSILVLLIAGAAIATPGIAPTATAATKGTSVRISIGFDSTLSGPLAPGLYGASGFFQAWISYTNAHGGIDGHKLNLITLDDKGDNAQTLLNFETLWSQDKVVLIAMESYATAPYAYVKANNVPLVTYIGDPRLYSSYYPSIITNGDNGGETSIETLYWLTHIEKKHPKVVAVMIGNAYSSWDSYVVAEAKKFGAQVVDMEPDGGASADCTATILKFKAEGVQFFDLAGAVKEVAPCVLAMQRVGWRPEYGAGGASSSQIGVAELIGQPFAGIIGGSPDTLYNGQPIYAHPTAIDKTLVGNVRKYDPQLANYSFLNGTSSLIGYNTARLVTYMLQGAESKFGSVTPAHILNFIHRVRNYSDGIQPPVTSFANNCKTGSDGTIWGYWHYNSMPTATKPSVYMVPTSGPQWITAAGSLRLPKCELTNQANTAYPNG